MKILLLGANGQVGTELQRSLARVGTVVAATRMGMLSNGTPCEVADFDALDSLAALVARAEPAIVVNATAYTAVDGAEDEPELAQRINAEAPGIIADVCAERRIPLIHYSTDYVFDGTGSRPYLESDPVAPLGVYGASKLAGEEAIRSSGAQHLILRTAWVYASHGKNFLLTILRLARERDELRVVADQVGTPTPAALIADLTADMLSEPLTASGTWHLTAAGQSSWHTFASEIVQRAHALGMLAKAPAVVPIPSDAFPTKAKRPAYSCLDTTRLRQDFRLAIPEWRLGLDAVLAELAG